MVAFVENEDAGLHLSKEDQQSIAKQLVRLPAFQIRVLLALGGVALGCFGIIAYVGGVIERHAARAMSDIKTSVVEEAAGLYTNTRGILESQIMAQANEMTNRISREFETPRIGLIVSNVAALEASHLMVTRLAPQIVSVERQMTNRLVTVENDLERIHSEAERVETNLIAMQQSAQTNAAVLNAIASVYSLVIMAQNDNRDAFWKLQGIADSKDDPMKALAHQASVSIGNQINLNHVTLLNSSGDPWRGSGINETSASLQQFIERLGQSDDIARAMLLGQVAHQTRFPLSYRFAIVANWIRGTHSLMVQNEACFIMGEYSGEDKNFMAFQDQLDWYDNWLKTNKVQSARGAK